jgi:hypothetical protein
MLNEEQFDLQIASSKDSDTVDIEMTLRENYQINQGQKAIGICKINMSELL